jgi:hypothetical protein
MCFIIRNKEKPEALEILKEGTIGLRKSDLYAIYHKLFQISLSDTPRKSVTFSLLEDTSFTAYSGNPGYFIMTKSPE